MAETVHKNVPQTVGQTRVDTQTDGVLVLQDGRAITVPLSVCCPMERTVSIHAMNSVLTRRVTKSTGVVCIVVEKINVIQILSNILDSHQIIWQKLLVDWFAHAS